MIESSISDEIVENRLIGDIEDRIDTGNIAVRCKLCGDLLFTVSPQSEVSYPNREIRHESCELCGLSIPISEESSCPDCSSPLVVCGMLQAVLAELGSVNLHDS